MTTLSTAFDLLDLLKSLTPEKIAEEAEHVPDEHRVVWVGDAACVLAMWCSRDVRGEIARYIWTKHNNPEFRLKLHDETFS